MLLPPLQAEEGEADLTDFVDAVKTSAKKALGPRGVLEFTRGQIQCLHESCGYAMDGEEMKKAVSKKFESKSEMRAFIDKEKAKAEKEDRASGVLVDALIHLKYTEASYGMPSQKAFDMWCMDHPGKNDIRWKDACSLWWSYKGAVSIKEIFKLDQSKIGDRKRLCIESELGKSVFIEITVPIAAVFEFDFCKIFKGKMLAAKEKAKKDAAKAEKKRALEEEDHGVAGAAAEQDKRHKSDSS